MDHIAFLQFDIQPSFVSLYFDILDKIVMGNKYPFKTFNIFNIMTFTYNNIITVYSDISYSK